MRLLATFLLALCVTLPLTAQPLSRAVDRATAIHEALIEIADCTVRKRPRASHDLAVATRLSKELIKPLKPAMSECLRGHWAATKIQTEGYVWKAELALSLLRQPNLVAPDFVSTPLPQPPRSDLDIVDNVAKCIVKADTKAARAFTDAVPGLPAEKDAFAPISGLASKCIEPWPNYSLGATLLRAGLGAALYRQWLDARVRPAS